MPGFFYLDGFLGEVEGATPRETHDVIAAPKKVDEL
jgi:hypothetical protein